MIRPLLVIFFLMLGLVSTETLGGVIINGIGLSGGARWDAAPRIFNGNERSLDGGLRYSISGGSYTALRDSFSWSATPSATQFQLAVEQAFAAWESSDPVSGIGTSVSFSPDFSTGVVHGNFGSIVTDGAEIDIVASNAGDGGLRGFTSLQPVGTTVTLTSGVSNYAGSQAIAGVDLHLNNNVNAIYTLDAFRRVLTHELGHAIGIEDVDLGGSEFIDDNFDPNSPVATLNNSWTHLVDPIDPANSSGLAIYNISPTTFSLQGIDLLMESNGLGVGSTNPIGNLVPLTNDEYGTRQFLYPTSVPEPSSCALMIGALAITRLKRRRS